MNRGRGLAVGCAIMAVSLSSPGARAEDDGTQPGPSAESAASSEPEPGSTADERPGRFGRVFFYGGSPGEPSSGKWVTLAALYTLSVGSLTLSAVQFSEYMQARHTTAEFLAERDGAGPCFDLAAQSCANYSELLGKQQQSATFATAGLAGFGLLLLSGVLTAQVWDNDLGAGADALAKMGWGNARLQPRLDTQWDRTGAVEGLSFGVSGVF